MKKKVFFCIFLIFCCIGHLGAQVSLFFDSNQAVREKAYSEAISLKDSLARKNAIDELIRILQTNQGIDSCFHGTLHLAIMALGELRANKAIDPLVAYLEYIPCNFVVEEMVPTQMYYPAIIAYIKIGEPSISKMKLIISDPNWTDEQKEIAAYVILKIVGKEKAIQQLNKVENKSLKARLKNGQVLSSYLKDFKPTFHRPKPYKNRNEK